MSSNTVWIVVACICAATSSNAAVAAVMSGTHDYPDKPIRIIDAFQPGGTADYIARIIGPKLTDKFGQPVIVENRPGAGGNLGAETAAKATPDGYTYFSGVVPNLASSASLYEHLNYNVLKDFSYVTLLASGNYVLIVKPGLAKSVKELVAIAKSKPGELRYGSAGVGTIQHLYMELFKRRAGVELLHVPYKGAPALIAAVAAGEVHLGVPSIVSALALIKAQRLTALAVTGSKRFKDLPDVPTVAESGFPGFDTTPWYGLLAPAGTPRNIVRAMNATLAEILRMPDVRATLATQALEAESSTPERFKQVMQAEIAVWKKVVKEANIKAE